MSDNDDLCRHAIAVTDVTRAVSGLDHAAVERSLRFSLIAGWAKTRFVDWHGNDGKAGRFRCHEQHHPRRAPWKMALIGWWGHKWFFLGAAKRCASGAGADYGRFVLLFLCRAFLPDGQRNAIRLERLKDKLGNRSNASCEVEFQDAIGWLLGAGRGKEFV